MDYILMEEKYIVDSDMKVEREHKERNSQIGASKILALPKTNERVVIADKVE